MGLPGLMIVSGVDEKYARSTHIRPALRGSKVALYDNRQPLSTTGAIALPLVSR
jgi:hypothetical protein